MAEFDLRDPDVRLLECAKCHEPVAGDARTPRMTLTCGYCGFEDVRELAPPLATEDASAYRGKAHRQPKPLRIDLAAHLEGVPARATLAQVRPLVGGARWLAVALRVDAHENVGEAKLARQLWREASRGNATVLSSTASAYGLAPATRKRVQLAAVFALPGFAAFLWGAFQLLRSVLEGPTQPHGLVPLAIGLLVVLVATRL